MKRSYLSLVVLLVFLPAFVVCGCDRDDGSVNRNKPQATTTSSARDNESTTPSPPPHSAETLVPPRPKIVKTIKADLNGDSKPEGISISDIRPSGDFVLHINDLTGKGNLKSIGVPADGFVVVDIDTSDRYKEVGVHTPGPSDDDVYLFYWYDGSAIHEMQARLGRWPKFPGNGIVYVDSWMGFWKITDKYVLTKERNLRLVPQQFHYVGETGMVHKSIPLYEQPASSNIVANLKVNSPIVVVLADLTGNPEEAQDIWYLIKTETNLLGWTKGHVFPDSISAGISAD